MPDLPVLDATEQRILGSLLEKQRTVPANYPLSLNSLRTACNQTSSREPVLDLEEQRVETVARELKNRGLLRIVWSDTGRRTLKYHQVLDEELALQPDERALMTVLLLRGPQAPGELKTRTDRLHTFADRGAVEMVLQRMAALPTPLVRQLERRPGQQDPRWVHLLGPVEEPAVAGPVGAVDREIVLADGAEARDAKILASYTSAAQVYAENLSSELDVQPFERWLLSNIVERADGSPVVEVGTGPGHVTAFLADAGARATGIDLTPAMIEQARKRFPDGDYRVGDLRQLMRPTDADGWGAVLAWYSLVHMAASELAQAVAAMARPIRSGGWLVLALHAGDEVKHADTWFEAEIDLDFVLQDPAHVRSVVEAAGLVDVEWYVRGRMPHRKENNDRLYVLGRKP